MHLNKFLSIRENLLLKEEMFVHRAREYISINLERLFKWMMRHTEETLPFLQNENPLFRYTNVAMRKEKWFVDQLL